MEAHDKICFCFPLKRERVRRAGHGGSAQGVAGVTAFSVPEQPHTAKPFLRLPEMTAGREEEAAARRRRREGE